MVTRTSVVASIDAVIRVARGHKVILDSDLAKLYGVPVKVLNQAVRRNLERFPIDFMFQLGWEELDALRSQIVTLDGSRPERSRHRFRLEQLGNPRNRAPCP